jgi:hypothetical protein
VEAWKTRTPSPDLVEEEEEEEEDLTRRWRREVFSSIYGTRKNAQRHGTHLKTSSYIRFPIIMPGAHFRRGKGKKNMPAYFSVTVQVA